jgi:uncharacterized delta-60 repeat protein
MKKSALPLLIFLSCVTISVYAQTFTLDESFGQNGRTTIPNTTEINFFNFDRHGNIVAAGYAYTGQGKHQMFIAKTNADGIFDKSFGNNGLVIMTDYYYSIPYGMKITNDNKIVVFGNFAEEQYQGHEVLLMRFNEDGSVDEKFGDNGKVNLDFNLYHTRALNMESDDYMLIVRYDTGEAGYNTPDYFISKYNYEGVLDESFGNGGNVSITNPVQPYCMKILKDSSIIVAGSYSGVPSNPELGLFKLTPVGELDTDFADDGIWRKDIEQGPFRNNTYESITHVLEDNKGNLILSGPMPAILGEYGNISPFLCKLSSGGILDTGFGDNGFYWFYHSSFSLLPHTVLQIGEYYIIAGLGPGNMISVKSDGSSANTVYTGALSYITDFKIQGNNKIIFISGDLLERITFDLSNSIKHIEFDTNSPVIFPNPAKEILYFSEETAFEIIDMQGTVLLKSSTTVQSVRIGNLRAGMYFVRLGNNVRKLIIR